MFYNTCFNSQYLLRYLVVNSSSIKAWWKRMNLLIYQYMIDLINLQIRKIKPREIRTFLYGIAEPISLCVRIYCHLGHALTFYTLMCVSSKALKRRDLSEKSIILSQPLIHSLNHPFICSRNIYWVLIRDQILGIQIYLIHSHCFQELT